MSKTFITLVEHEARLTYFVTITVDNKGKIITEDCHSTSITPTMHITIEKFLDYYSKLFNLYRFRIFRPFYHFIYGLICGYNISAILHFITKDLETFKP